MPANAAMRQDADGRVSTTMANLIANRIYIKKNTPYSFEDRPFMIPIFDDPCREMLLKTARQISKCVDENAPILMGDGSYKAAKDIHVGDVVATMDDDGASMTTEKIVWVSERLQKPGRRIRTRLGHVLDLGVEHPVRVWGDWRKAQDLKVGDRVASARRLKKPFPSDVAITDERVRLTSKLIGDGYISKADVSFTQLPGASLDEFQADLRAIGTGFGVSQKRNTSCFVVRSHRDGPLREWMRADGLMGTHSETKFLPSWVFRLDHRQAALFLNRLWSTDGMVKQPKPNLYQVSYCTTSHRLARGVQAMLWKFGVPTSIKERKTATTLGDGSRVAGENAFIVRVETQDGLRRFLSDVGALGKSETVTAPSWPSNNNRNTLPIDIGVDVECISASAGFIGKKGVPHDGTSLLASGLRRSPEYAMTPAKLGRYVEHFRAHPNRYDQQATEALSAHVDSDIIWDEIVSIEDIGSITCVDFEVATHHNFLVDGVVTHNSTTIAGRILCNGEVYAPYATLFLSPSHDQTSKFSHQRLGPTINQSPHLAARVNDMCLQNVLEKEFSDGSMIYLSYAKDNADRARGISVDEIDFDEIQDMHLANVEPVVRESLFTSRYKRRFYSGTPKSLSNGIEHLWRESDRREWMVACRHHTPVFHQALGPKNVGKQGVVCAKAGCGRPLNTLDGLWVRTSTRTPEGKVPFIHGYHLPQIVFPTTDTVLPSGETGFLDWQGFIRDLEDPKAEESTILNEKFGESADSASKPISEEKLRSLCYSDRLMAQEYQERFIGSMMFAGVDWGMGLGSSTALTIGQFDPRAENVFRIVACFRFDGDDADPETCVPQILQICDRFRVKRVHADWGGGAGINSRIIAERQEGYLTTNYWSSSISAKLVNYEANLNRFVINKSITMTKFFLALKRDAIKIDFRWEEYSPFAQDILNEFREERKNGDPYFDHPPGTQDDFLHSHIYCWLVACWDRSGADYLENARRTGTTHNPSSI